RTLLFALSLKSVLMGFSPAFETKPWVGFVFPQSSSQRRADRSVRRVHLLRRVDACLLRLGRRRDGRRGCVRLGHSLLLGRFFRRWIVVDYDFLRRLRR